MLIINALANDGKKYLGESVKAMVPLVMITLIFYFIVIRPQHKKIKSHHHMVDHLRKGDEIITSGGILGSVCKIDTKEDTVIVEIAENVKIKIQKDAISKVIKNFK